MGIITGNPNSGSSTSAFAGSVGVPVASRRDPQVQRPSCGRRMSHVEAQGSQTNVNVRIYLFWALSSWTEQRKISEAACQKWGLGV